MIEFRDFSCYYKVKKGFLVALDGIDLTVGDGELLVVAGESGSGKTTLLRAVLNMIDNTSGELIIDGTPVSGIDYKDNLFAYVSQQYVLYPRMIIYENIAFPLRNMNTRQEEVDLRVREIAKELGIYHLFTRKPSQLSGGQHQKLAAARTFAKPSPVKIFDEPSSALDPIAEFELFKNIMKEGKDHTMLFISHRLSSVKNCDRVLMLEGGRLIEEGTHKELIALGGSYCEMYKRQAMNYLAIENEEEVIL